MILSTNSETDQVMAGANAARYLTAYLAVMHKVHFGRKKRCQPNAAVRDWLLPAQSV